MMFIVVCRASRKEVPDSFNNIVIFCEQTGEIGSFMDIDYKCLDELKNTLNIDSENNDDEETLQDITDEDDEDMEL
jgi:hypothetical protein